MKSRKGFVSNSSSTNYIVCVGSDEKFSDWKREIKQSVDRFNDDEYIDSDEKQSTQEVWNEVKSLQQGEIVWEAEDYNKWSVLVDLFSSSNSTLLELGTFESGGKIANICAPEKISQIRRIMGE